MRGKDLNLRPLGYEPNELPLLHPAVLIQYIGSNNDASMDIGIDAERLGRDERYGVGPVGELAGLAQGTNLECVAGGGN